MFFVAPEYFYLLLTAPFILIWVLLYFFQPKIRKELLTLSIIGAIIGPVSEILYIRDYWLPQSVLPIQIGSFTFMFEDVLFGFTLMGIAGVVYEVLLKTRQYRIKKHHPYARSSMTLLVFFLILLLTLFVGLNSIYASAIAFTVTSLFMLLLRRDLFLNAVFSGFAVMVVMFMVYIVVFSISTNIEDLMNVGWLLHETPLDWRILNIPMTEMIWGLSLGFMVGPLYEFLYHRKLSKVRI